MMIDDEFSFLQADADRWALEGELPSVERVQVRTEEGDLGALMWGQSPPEFAFFHGAGLNAHTWDTTMLALRGDAVVFDLPGHGDSDWRDDFDYRPETIAPALAEGLRQLSKARPVTLIGHSLGGLAALAVAVDHPDLVDRLVVIDITPSPPMRRSPASEFIAGPESYASREEILDRGVAFGLGADRESLRRGVSLNTRFRPDGRVVFKHHLANRPAGLTMPEVDLDRLWTAAERLSIPALLISGTKGNLADEQAREFVRRVPNATTLRLDASHNVHHDQPILLARAIREFSQI